MKFILRDLEYLNIVNALRFQYSLYNFFSDYVGYIGVKSTAICSVALLMKIILWSFASVLFTFRQITQNEFSDCRASE